MIFVLWALILVLANNIIAEIKIVSLIRENDMLSNINICEIIEVEFNMLVDIMNSGKSIIVAAVIDHQEYIFL